MLIPPLIIPSILADFEHDFMFFNKPLHILTVFPVAAMVWATEDTDSVQSVEVLTRTDSKAEPSTPQSNGGVRLHEFVSKTVCLSLIPDLRILF